MVVEEDRSPYLLKQTLYTCYINYCLHSNLGIMIILLYNMSPFTKVTNLPPVLTCEQENIANNKRS